MDMRLIYTNRKAVEAVEVKKELKVPPLHPHYGRKTRPETLERARLFLIYSPSSSHHLFRSFSIASR